jgi:hypothetical protein
MKRTSPSFALSSRKSSGFRKRNLAGEKALCTFQRLKEIATPDARSAPKFAIGMQACLPRGFPAFTLPAAWETGNIRLHLQNQNPSSV